MKIHLGIFLTALATTMGLVTLMLFAAPPLMGIDVSENMVGMTWLCLAATLIVAAAAAYALQQIPRSEEDENDA